MSGGDGPGGFMPGLDLAERFYSEAVQPILDDEYPGHRYAAALLGSGSDVLGYDTPQSMDHHWGPRLQLFLAESAGEWLAPAISDTLSRRLPTEIHGIPTNFGPPDEIGVRLLQPVESGPVQHMIEITTVERFFRAALGIDPKASLAPRDWLSFPQQRLLEVTAGRVFHDDLGLEGVRARFAWYPRDVWLYVLASQWQRIGQEEAFVGRTGDVGDEIGSAIIAGRLVRDLMRLVFLNERRYAPYSKWLGTAFSRLSAAPELLPVFHAVQQSRTWQERERHLSQAYGIVARRHNDLGITAPLPVEVSPFHDRPYQVIHAGRFAAALQASIDDPSLRVFPLIGSVDQITDNTDVLSDSQHFRPLAALYESVG